jgi:peptidoglycan/xylan/chitin deacetylase (PgdA/CDA1 family)
MLDFLFMINKFLVKKILLSFFSKLGFLKYLHWKNRHKICVLMLHGVMDNDHKASWNPLRPQLSPHELKRTLTILSEFYQFITVDQAVGIIEGKVPVIKNAMLITLDDGYRNNLDYALPIFGSFGIKPVLFVVTGNVDSGLPFMVDRLDYALQQYLGNSLSINYAGKLYEFDTRSRKSLQKSYKYFRDDCKDKFFDDIKMNQLFNRLAEIIEKKSGKSLQNICQNDDWSALVSWEMLRKETKEGNLDVASHTVEHLRLDRIDELNILSQLKISKLRIEQELKIKCNYFCYPNGNYNDLSIKKLKEVGYRAAFTTDVGMCGVNDEEMTLKRFNFTANKSENEMLYLINRCYFFMYKSKCINC